MGTGTTSKDGYAFNGWTVVNDGKGGNSSNKVVYDDEAIVQIPADATANVVLKADWTALNAVIYNVGAAVSGTVPEKTFADVDGNVTIGEPNLTAPEGKVFVGWEITNTPNTSGNFVVKDGDVVKVVSNGTVVAPKAKMVIKQDLKLTAKFEDALAVTYKSGDATEGIVPAATPADANGYVTLAAPTNIVAPEGKEFAGWEVTKPNYDTDGTAPTTVKVETINGFETLTKAKNLIKAGTRLQISAATEVTAQWKDLPTLTYLAGGATGTLPVAEVVDSYATLADPVELVAPTGKEFAGWKMTAGEGSVKVVRTDGEIEVTTSTELKPGDVVYIEKNVTLTAQWTDVLTVTYKAGDDTVGGTLPEAEKAVDGIVTLAEPNKVIAPEGKAFDGWSVTTPAPTASNSPIPNVKKVTTAGEFDVKSSDKLEAGTQLKIEKPVEVTAQWKAIPTVKFGVDSSIVSVITGTLPETMTAEDGKFTVPGFGDLAVEGKSFDYWFISADSTGSAERVGTTANEALTKGKSEIHPGDKLIVDGVITLKAWFTDKVVLTYVTGTSQVIAPVEPNENNQVVVMGGDTLEKPADATGEFFHGWKITAPADLSTNKVYRVTGNTKTPLAASDLISKDDVLEFTTPITLTAQWDSKYDVILHYANNPDAPGAQDDTNVRLLFRSAFSMARTVTSISRSIISAMSLPASPSTEMVS